MQAEFITGFVKSAVDQGHDDDSIISLFKQAMMSPPINQMFKALPAQSGAMQVAPDQLQALSQAKQMMQNPAQLQMLQQMLAQQQPQGV